MPRGKREQSEPKVIDAVDRALAILECFTTERPTLSLADISRQLNMHKSTVFRCLESLEARDFVTRNDHGLYALGPRIPMLAAVHAVGLDIREKAKPVMEWLQSETDESVSLWVLNNDRVVCIERLRSTHPVRDVIRVGDHMGIIPSATGWVFLAHTPEAKQMALIAPTYDQWKHIVESGELERRLARVREQGYAIVLGGINTGISAVAAPIFDAEHHTVAVISISGPPFRFEGEVPAKYARMLVDGTKQVSQSLGYR